MGLSPMAELCLVCEGEPNSIDATILKQVFVSVLAAGISIESGGGIKGTGPIAAFLRRQRGGTVAYVNDRDYRPRDDAERAFADGQNGFLWRRHSIENYLLHPLVIRSALSRVKERFKPRANAPGWLAALPDDTDEISDMLRACAQSRAPEEACRMANHRLWKELPKSLGRIQKRNPPLDAVDDRIAPILWREALCQEVKRVSNSAAATASCMVFSRQNAIRHFDASFDEITAESYIGEMEFLIDFHGLDLLGELRLRVSPGRNALPDDRLVLGAAAEYEANPLLYGKDDFRDLANGVRALAGLGPVGGP